MTTNVIHSIGATNSPTTMDYSSLATWGAACPADLTIADEVWIGEIHNQGEIVLSAKFVMSVTSDATRNVILRAATGSSFMDNASVQTNALRYNAANGAAITGSIGYDILASFTACVETYGLQWRATSIVHQGVLALNGAVSIVHESILQMADTVKGNTALLTDSPASSTIITNSLFFFESLTHQATMMNCRSGGLVTNCTVISLNGGLAYQAGYGTLTINNCATFGFGIGSLGFYYNPSRLTTGSNNATDQPSIVGTGTNTLTNSVFNVPFSIATLAAVSGVTFGTGSGYDFRLATGSTLIDAGSNSGAPSIDIGGAHRPSGTLTDIGCWEWTRVFVNQFPPRLTFID